MPTEKGGHKIPDQPNNTVGVKAGIATVYQGSVNGATAVSVAGFYVPRGLATNGDRFEFEVIGDILNNSGVNVTFTWTVFVHTTAIAVGVGTLGPSANRLPFWLRSKLWVAGDIEHQILTQLRIGLGNGTLGDDLWTVARQGVTLNVAAPMSFFTSSGMSLWVVSNSVSANAQVRHFASDLTRFSM